MTFGLLPRSCPRKKDGLIYLMSENSPHERSLYRVMVIGTALSFGLLAAIAASMKDFFGGNAAFEFSAWTVIAFILGAAAGVGFWWLVRRWQMRRRS